MYIVDYATNLEHLLQPRTQGLRVAEVRAWVRVAPTVSKPREHVKFP
jgi:hypothetical protein